MPFAHINGQELFYEDSGGQGHVIMMMHGYLMDQSLFDPQVAVLAPRYRCIRFDARAFGQTKWDEKAFNLYDTAADCVGLMDFLNIPTAIILGMSQGGYAALRLAIKYPNRATALILLSTQSAVDDDNTIAQFNNMRDTWVSAGPVDPLIEGMATVLLGPKDAPGMDKIWGQWLPKWRKFSRNAIFHATNNLTERNNIDDQLAKITQPTVITHGDADVGMPMILGQQLSQQLKNCHGFYPIHGGAHAANFTHPQAVNEAILDFLRALRV